MVCLHYEVFAFDSQRNVVAKIDVYSFDEAYFFIDTFRERYQKAVEFSIKYPNKDIAKMVNGELNNQ